VCSVDPRGEETEVPGCNHTMVAYAHPHPQGSTEIVWEAPTCLSGCARRACLPHKSGIDVGNVQ